MKPLPHLLCLLGTLLLAGCVTPAPTPPAVTIAPAPEVDLPPASITGSEEESTMLDNFTVYVSAIDGVPVAAGRAGWSTALDLRPGPRRLTLAFNRGVFAAEAGIELTALSAAAYRVRFATDAQFLGANSYCEFWIEDAATGQPVTGRTRAPLRRIEPAK